MSKLITLSNAAGFDKTHEHSPATSKVLKERTYGSFTLISREGNDEPRYWFDQQTRMSLNAVGLANQSLQRFLEDDLPHIVHLCRETGCRIRISLAPTGENELRQMLWLIAQSPHASGIYEIEVNAACPNHRSAAGLQPVLAYNPSEVRRLLDETAGHATGCRLVLKIAPKTDEEVLREIVDLCVTANFQGIVSGNTLAQSSTVRGIKRLSQDTGGMAGAPLLAFALPQYHLLTRICDEIGVENDFDLIACGGIMDPGDVREYVKLGARRIQVGTYYAEFGTGGLIDMQMNLIEG